ncbi:MAG: Tol-Pal system beta propeller repeat protein TolB [Geobacteraceae bacterium]
MKKIFLTLLVILSPALVHGQQGFLDVTAPGNRQLQLGISACKSLNGGQNPEIVNELNDVLRFDMTLAGPFSVMSGTGGNNNSGIRPGDFNFAPWKAAGADLLVKSGYRLAGSTLTLEFRLFDVFKEKEIVAKRYTGNIRDLRKIAHTFDDQIMLAITGEKGPFTGKIAFVSNRTGNKEIYLMDYDGYNVQRLTRNGSINLNPDFSPNGREIIYTSYKRKNPNLYRRELFTGTEALISARRGVNITGAYSPDGKRIALTMSKDGNSEIYLIDTSGKQLARLTNNQAIDVSPAWSPDGSHIAFTSDRLGRPQIFVMKADGGDLHRLTTSGAYNDRPRWSPKGDRILYCRMEGNGFHIYAINPDGSGDTRLTSEGSNEHPRWSPDGRFITFSSKRGGKEAIYLMRADGSGQTKVSRGNAGDSHPTWSTHW